MPPGLTTQIVVNTALQMIASQTTISSLNDGSTAGNAAGVIYAPTVQLMLRLLEPDFARFTNALVSTGNPTPQQPWTEEYVYPADCVRLLQVQPLAGSYDVYDPQAISSNIGIDFLASGYIQFSVNPSPGDTVTLNGVQFTFVAGTPSLHEFEIFGSLGGTIALASQALNATPYTLDPNLNVATYGINQPTDNQLTVVAALAQAGLYTLAASAASASAATLVQSVGGKVILTDQSSAVGTYITSLVTEVQWDATFTDAVMRRLCNPLAMALSGRPDFARELLEESYKSAEQAEMVDESAVRPR